MLVLRSHDARADLAQFDGLGLTTYAPFDFERQAGLPDGTQVTVAFTLGFVTSPDLPDMAFFVCQQRAPEHFWKPEFQTHRNGAQGIDAGYIAARDPARHVAFLTKLTGGTSTEIDGGHRISCGDQELLVLTPERVNAIIEDPHIETGDEPRFVGIAVTSPAQDAKAIRAGVDCDMFVEWRSI